MQKITLKRKRIMTYFIDATNKIIEEEGISNVTIRKVADKAGYNSATIYGYFESLDHLILFASMKHVQKYALALPRYLEGVDNALDKFLTIWKCFCEYSFEDSDIYYSIFFANLDKDLEDYVEQYYELFPDELVDISEDVSTMLVKHNIYVRGMAIVNECVKEGYIKKEDADTLNEMATLIYEGILLKFIKGKIDYNNAVDKAMKYINLITDTLRIK